MNAINRGTTFYGAVEKPRKIEAFIAGDELAENRIRIWASAKLL